LHERALALFEKVHGPKHFITAFGVENYASLLGRALNNAS
jgi:hypothetical protein